jgi:hypothetical protein
MTGRRKYQEKRVLKTCYIGLAGNGETSQKTCKLSNCQSVVVIKQTRAEQFFFSTKC